MSKYFHNIGDHPLILGRHTIGVDEYKKVVRETDLDTDHVIDGIEKGWLEVVDEPGSTKKKAPSKTQVKTEEVVSPVDQGSETPEEATRVYDEAQAKGKAETPAPTPAKKTTTTKKA